jgi:hypothetical protein
MAATKAEVEAITLVAVFFQVGVIEGVVTPIMTTVAEVEVEVVVIITQEGVTMDGTRLDVPNHQTMDYIFDAKH